MSKRVRVLVSGRVQGVFFRAECARKARQLGLGGFVRNASNGMVQAAFEGDPDSVDRMVEWCRLGPDLAVVESVETSEEPATGETEFRVRH